MADDENGGKPADYSQKDNEQATQSKDDDGSQVSEESKRYSTLKTRKKSAKTRLTKAKNQIAMLTTVARAVKRIFEEQLTRYVVSVKLLKK